ncbi:MAG: nitrous oxide reductase family maturation protein NosD [Saprospiraceae bacterium]
MKQIALSFFFLVILQTLPARTWVVAPGAALASVQAAVDAADPYDTVLVRSGEYREAVIIEKPLTLRGEGWPLLDGEHRRQPMSIRSNHVSVSGFRVVRCGSGSLEDQAGIKVYNARYVYVFGNMLEDNYFGIYLSNSKLCWVTGNRLTAQGEVEQTSGNGIHAWKCDSITIADNRVQGHRDGIYFEFVTNSRIVRNWSEGNVRYGLHFMFSHNDSYEHNTFVGNGAGVAVMYTRNVTMRYNTFSENTGGAAYGILLKDIQSSHISDNVFLKNTAAIFMEGCTRSVLERNEFRQNGWALKVQASCDGNTFRNNNFFANTFDVSTNNQLVLNTFEKNYWDKYEGYDLNRDQIGDVPYRPVSLFAMVSDQMPYAMMFWRSFTVLLLDRAEKVIPSLSPDNLRDIAPLMKPYDPSLR